jgi:predicted nuclease with TOPRIM domain
MGEMLSKRIAFVLLLCLVGTTGFSLYIYSERSLTLSQLEEERESQEYWQAHYAALNSSYSSLKEQLENVTAEIKIQEEEKEALNQTYNFLLKSYTTLESNYTSLSANSSLQQNYTALSGGYLALLDERQILQQNLTETIKERDAWVSAYETLNATHAILFQNYTACLEEIGRLNQRIAQLEGELNFADFNTLNDLEVWLAQDNTSEHAYIPDEYDCDDFAYDLMASAFRAEYKMGTVAVYYTSNLTYVVISEEYYYKVPLAYTVGGSYMYYIFGNHMVNIAYVGDTGWVLIEPQTDQVFPLNTYEL